jgi:hypothetical protein
MRNPPIVDPLGSHRIVEDITSAQRKVAEIHDPSLRCLLAGTLDRQCDLCARLHRLEAGSELHSYRRRTERPRAALA